jgi:hypothetical protein
MWRQQSWETGSVVAREVAQNGDTSMKNAGETAGVRSSEFYKWEKLGQWPLGRRPVQLMDSNEWESVRLQARGKY